MCCRCTVHVSGFLTWIVIFHNRECSAKQEITPVWFLRSEGMRSKPGFSINAPEGNAFVPLYIQDRVSRGETAHESLNACPTYKMADKLDSVREISVQNTLSSTVAVLMELIARQTYKPLSATVTFWIVNFPSFTTVLDAGRIPCNFFHENAGFNVPFALHVKVTCWLFCADVSFAAALAITGRTASSTVALLMDFVTLQTYKPASTVVTVCIVIFPSLNTVLEAERLPRAFFHENNGFDIPVALHVKVTFWPCCTEIIVRARQIWSAFLDFKRGQQEGSWMHLLIQDPWICLILSIGFLFIGSRT